MSWDGNNVTVMYTSPKNYMYNELVFLLEEISVDTCAYLIGDLTAFIMNPDNLGKVLTFIINSPGGEVDTMYTLLSLINIAKLNEIEVHTFVMGSASSCASLIAASGDVRMISKHSKHLIHFGTICDITQKYTEMEKIYTQNKEYADQIHALYVEFSNNKLTVDNILSLQTDERGYLSAEDCIKYGLADSILENRLILKKQKEQEREIFEAEFEKSINAKKNKVNKKIKK